MAAGYQKRFGELFKYDIEAELACFEEYRKTMKEYVVDGVFFMASAQQSDKKIVIEGANVLFSFPVLNRQCLLPTGTNARY